MDTRTRSAAARIAATSLAATVIWLMVGDLGITIRERAALPTSLELLRRNGASDTITSLLVSTVPALLSLLLVPLVGYHSDRYHGRWGRRRPFLLAVTPFAALAMLGLAFSPVLASAADRALGTWSPGLRACSLACFCLFWTMFECAAVTVLALFTGLVNDLMPKAVLGRFYAILRIVSLSAGIGFNSLVFALTDAYLYQVLAGLALLFCLPIVLMCVMIKEDRRAGPAPAPATVRAGLVPRAHVLDCFSQRPMLWIFAAFMLAGITFNPFNTFCQYFAEGIGLSKAELGTMTAYGYGFSILSAFGVGALVDRLGAVRVATILMGMYLLTAAAGYTLITDSASFRVFYCAHVVISGAYFTAAASMPMALFPNAKFVQFNSTKDLLVACASILLSSAQGPVLDWAGHDYRLTLLSASVTSLLCIACLLKVRGMPLGRPASVQAALLLNRAATAAGQDGK
jgi:maltose/moltooligosaccharide transporter